MRLLIGVAFLIGLVSGEASAQGNRIGEQAVAALAGRSPVAALLYHRERLRLSTDQLVELQRIETNTLADNRRVLERVGIVGLSARGQAHAHAEPLLIERDVLFEIRENLRLGAVRARAILTEDQRVLERELLTRRPPIGGKR